MPRISKKFVNGAVEDKRTDEEKRNDYQAEEIAMFAPINWQEIPQEKWRQFPIFQQDGSGSCVAQATVKALGIENYLEEQKFVQFSARDIYTRRKNNGIGMWLQDALDIGRKFGATIEQLMPSQGLNEDKMNDKGDRTLLTEQVALPGRGGNYLFIEPPTIDKVASVIEPKGKPVILLVMFNLKEWNKAVPEISNEIPDARHGVAATQAFLYQGKKAILIEDSWGSIGLGGRRVLTEGWFNGRVYSAGYFEDLKNAVTIEKPKYVFNNDLFYGMTANEDVKMLQRCLNYLKLFPDRDIYTGNFYGLTLKGVKAYQILQGITASGRVDATTIQKLNEEFK